MLIFANFLEGGMNARHKTSQNATASTFTPKPLSVEQLNAIPLLCAGLTDAEVAQQVGVVRETVWSWRNEVPLFMAELEKARQQFIASAIDTLRSALPTAVSNIVHAVEAGNLKASLALLRCVGLEGHAAFQPGETDAGAIAMNIVRTRMAEEHIPQNGMDAIMGDLDKNPKYEQRRAEILAELGSA
jgi:predicted DNA-binding protein (UPF0251 family)